MNQSSGSIRAGISVGDINGIGIEVILKTFEDKRMLELVTPILYASKKLIATHKNKLGFSVPLHSIYRVDEAIPGKINVLNVWKEDVSVNFGEISEISGKYARLSLQKAITDLKNTNIDVLITAPIHKNSIHAENFPFPGHTEFLESELEGEALMILISDTIKVALLTGHIPLHKVSESITPGLIQKKTKILHDTLREDFSISKPKIALLSINPHAGDQGIIGDEDDRVMTPAIQALQKEGMLVYGPFAADGFFGSGSYKNYDAILASYHDQGLTAFKTLSFGKGVNFTAGLNRIRTSPDHGTAFQIAGKNQADARSFRESVYKAIDIFRTRKENKNLKQNALT